MTQKTNNSGRFWKELKRRRVFSVVTAYAATAYIIIEITNNVVSPLHLPAWIATLVILLLMAGLPIAIILSWIFDFTPHGLKKTESFDESEKRETAAIPSKRRLRPSYVLNAVLIIAVIVLVYPKIFKRDTFEKLRYSGEKIVVTIMPFQNMTNDTTWNIWQDGIQNELITSLTNSEELRVRQTESINNLIRSNGLTNYASITPSVASKISQKLDADVYIIGTIKQAGYTIRINAQLIDLKTEEVFKSFQMDGKTENILHIIDSLSVEIKNFLIMSELKKEHSYETDATISTKSPEAYRYYLNGLKSFIADDFTSARNMFFQSLAIDPNFTDVIFYTSTSYGNQGLYEQAKKWCLVAYTKKDLMPMRGKLYTNWLYANYFETPNEAIKYLRQIQELDDQEPTAYFLLGNAYLGLYQYDKAIPEYEKLLGIYKKWDLKPHWVYNYTYLGHAYHETGQYNKEKNVYKKAEQDFPDNPVLIYRQAVLALSEENLREANSCIDRFISISKESSSSEAEIGTNVSGNFSSEAAIARNVAEIYSEANMLNKAEEYCRQALSLEPESSHRLNDLAYFLIDKDRNIKEGLELADKALEISPDYYIYLHTKGWGLYKQGRIKEALDVLQKSWDLRMKNAIYDHEAFLHLKAAKKAFTRSF